MHSVRRLIPSALLILCLAASGCRIRTQKDKDGKSEDVSIGTPFGSMHVQTDEAAATAKLGLTPYPGSTRVVGEKDNNGAADVSMNFGSFKLGVHALELQTADPEDKVLAFYRKDMARYGAVITCRGKETVGTPSRTEQGLTCNNDTHGQGDHDLDLKAGSEVHQHIVGIHQRDGGTHIGLVSLDLPSSVKDHDTEDRE